jgi:hypothetical protein
VSVFNQDFFTVQQVLILAEDPTYLPVTPLVHPLSPDPGRALATVNAAVGQPCPSSSQRADGQADVGDVRLELGQPGFHLQHAPVEALDLPAEGLDLQLQTAHTGVHAPHLGIHALGEAANRAQVRGDLGQQPQDIQIAERVAQQTAQRRQAPLTGGPLRRSVAPRLPNVHRAAVYPSDRV